MIKKLFQHFGSYKKMMFLCMFFVIIEVLCEVAIPLLMARIVDVGVASGDIGYVLKIGAAMVGLILFAIAMGICSARCSSLASQGFASNLRRSLFDQIQSFSFANIDKFSDASLITRMTNDVTQLQTTSLMAMRMLVRAPFMLISALFIAITINLQLSMIVFGAITVLVIGISFLIRNVERLYSAVQEKLDGLNGTVQENLIAVRVVKAFVREKHEKVKFKKANDAYMNAAVKAGSFMALMMPIMMGSISMATILVIWFGGIMVGNGVVGAGELLSFISYLMQIMISVIMFAMILMMVARAKVSAGRVLEVMDEEADIQSKQNLLESGNAPRVTRGDITFQNVSFRYKGDHESQNVLRNLDFSIGAGEFVGIIGGTGSGKTSLVNLIPRFYDATDGAVLVDGVDVKEYKLEELRQEIGMVLQKNNLFSGTIRENLLWGNENATQEEIESAAISAQAHGFISSFPKGYETELGQGGVNVSGGQKQRLCIARAMMKDPKILILDDSTSAVDTATEANIRKSFYEQFKDTTVIIVAQRISSIQDADKILVLDDGVIVGMGTHDELLAENPVYQEICQSQIEGMVS